MGEAREEDNKIFFGIVQILIRKYAGMDGKFQLQKKEFRVIKSPEKKKNFHFYTFSSYKGEPKMKII